MHKYYKNNNNNKTKIFWKKNVGNLTLFWEGHFHDSQEWIHILQWLCGALQWPWDIWDDASGDGSLALILSLCKDERHLQRWGLVMWGLKMGAHAGSAITYSWLASWGTSPATFDHSSGKGGTTSDNAAPPTVNCELQPRQHHLENKSPRTEVISYVLLG